MVRKGIVSSSHQLASYWGARCLEDGGNVVDAAIATSSILSVVQNNMCGLGGDMFALVKLDGRVSELNSSGRASEAATIDFYEKKGYTQIPARGPLGANTVPGMVRGWGDLLGKFGTMELKTLLQPAIKYAEEGFPITEKYAASIRESASVLGEFHGWREIFMPEGKPPSPGFNLVQKDLARSLGAISERGVDDFYEGDLAKRISDGIAGQGGIISIDDLRNHESTWNFDPISTNYRGVKIYETSPNSQAATVLLWLNMLEHYEISEMGLESEEFAEVMVDTCLKCYSQRAKSIADPTVLPLPAGFTSKQFADSLLSANDNRAVPARNKNRGIDGDTTYFAVADSDGNCISVIQSNYMGFGSGLVPKGTGIVLHDRGCYFTLDRAHHNSLAPKKRTFHTLCASLGERDGETLFAIGSMGGDVQPQIQVQLMTQVIDFGIDIQRAIDRPRWIVPATIYETPSNVFTEAESPVINKVASSIGLSAGSLNGLSSLCGHAQAILRSPEGLFGSADPRGDGASVGF